MERIILFFLLNIMVWNMCSQTDITVRELENHIKFLTSEKNAGRYPGGKENRWVVKYIKKEFRHLGILPFENGYKQVFKVILRTDKINDEKQPVTTCNVVGYIEGNDPLLKNEYIVLGAHYDHLGLGGPSSKSDRRGVVYHGADDNASGTAALLEIAEKLVSKRGQLKRSVLIIAFGAEEQGLKGSSYFVEHPTVPLPRIKLMVNMDMVGRLNEEKQVYMGGAGTFPCGEQFMATIGTALGLNPIIHAGSVGGSDHVSFYNKKISVLGIHTGAHPQYHTPGDTLEFINLEGEKQVCEYVFQTVLKKASSTDAIYFIAQD